MATSIVCRYAFLPQVLFAFTLLGLANLSGNKVHKISQIGIFFILLTGLTHFTPPAFFAPQPYWLEQIAKWRKDRSYIVKIAPSGWTMDLKGYKSSNIMNHPSY